jgi:16S rRNA (cytosine1402-N4)-methyltransferase
MHIPVLLKEVIEYLDPKPNENYIDCTLSTGGHAKEILKRIAPSGKALGIEVDKDIFEKISAEGIERLIPVNDSYVNLKEIIEENEFNNVSGILFDLGMSSWHIDESEKGFSFQKDEPLIMNYGKGEITAEEIVNEFSEREIETIIREYGEENFSKRIAKAIVEQRKRAKIKTTSQLVEIIRQAVPGLYTHAKPHFATRTFQALRIRVNQELDNVSLALPQALEALDKGGRLVAISFHSLEDRIVKEFLREKERSNELKILTKKPIVPGTDETISNPRARSSKLRVAIKI